MKKRWIFAPSLLVAAGAAVYLGARPAADPVPADPALRVVLSRRDLVIEVVDSGKVEPRERVEIKSKLAGQVAAVRVVEGQRVHRGDALVELDPAEARREVARAETDLAQSTNALALADLELERKRKGEAERAVARYEVEVALHNKESRRIAVDAARIALETARDHLRWTRIESPIDGTVLELGIKLGEVVTPGVQQTFEGRPLMVIGDLSTLRVRAELNQIDVAQVALGQRVDVSFDALPGRRFEATVTKSAPAAIRPQGKEVDVFPVESTLVSTSTAIRPGMTADLRYRVAVRPSVLSAPIEAVVKKDGHSRVTRLITREGREQTEQVEVQLGARNDRAYEIVGGVAEGDTLLIDPASSKPHEVEL
jgi:HlyD family secretion protein/macrolide-specific efflux system membrane fusion protein